MRKKYFSSRMFIRLFLSYIAIITVAMTVYTSVILHETSSANKSDMTRYYTLKQQELKNVFESYIMEARNATSRVKASQIIRNLYINMTASSKSVDPYTLYQSITELSSARSVNGNTNIYDMLLFLTGDYRVYTGGGVLVLPEVFKDKALDKEKVSRNTLIKLLGISDIPDLRFQKEYFIYYDNYSYYSDSTSKGLLFVLMDLQNIERSIGKLVGEGESFKIYEKGVPVIENTEYKGNNGVVFTSESSLMPDLEYELIVDKSKFNIKLNTSLFFILLIGTLTSFLFIFFAYYFSCSYYKPIGNIKNLFFLQRTKLHSNEMDDIVDGITSLIGERDDYKNRMSNVRPFVQQAILHTLMAGNLDREEAEYLFESNNIPLKGRFFSAAVFNIGLAEGVISDGLSFSTVRRYISEAADSCSSSSMNLLCYEKDYFNIIVIINSDGNEDISDLIYKMYGYVKKKIYNSQIAITVGVDDMYNDLSLLPAACSNAMKALDSMLLEGRGSIFFYNTQFDIGDTAYYFPADFQFRIVKAVRSGDTKAIDDLFDDIYKRNISEYDWSPKTIRILLYELYMVTQKILVKLNLQNDIKVDAERIEVSAPLKEVFEYYKGFYAELCQKAIKVVQTCDKNNEIIEYVRANCFDPTISLQSIAEHFGLSAKFISTMFNKKLNIGYVEFLHNKRMELAMELLKNSCVTIDEVCEKCGYSSILTFRRHFLNATGLNPSDYQRKFDIC
jgi:AraC-like DNA-binding protein